jgi:hypothetical protein
MVNFTNTLNLSTHNGADPYNFNLKTESSYIKNKTKCEGKETYGYTVTTKQSQGGLKEQIQKTPDRRYMGRGGGTDTQSGH